MSTKLAAMLAALAVVGAACSSPRDDEAAPGAREGPAVVTAAPDATVPEEEDGRKPGDGADDDEKQETMAGGSRGGSRAGPGIAGGGGSAPGATRQRAVRHPGAGRYVYEQNGYERYCRGATCSREELPPTQPVELSIKGRGDGRVTLESEARISSSRSSKTTTRYASRRALVTQATVRFSHEQVNYSNTYRPQPPIALLRFPLRVGRSWSGSWRDNVSGSYRVQVAGRDRVKVRGGAVPAFRLETFTRFSGEFDGTADVVVWVDPTTRGVLASRGEVKLRSFFGTFESEFRTRLRSGPGYR